MNQNTQERNPDYPSGDRSIHIVRLLDFRKSFSKPPAATAKKKTTSENRYMYTKHFSIKCSTIHALKNVLYTGILR